MVAVVVYILFLETTLDFEKNIVYSHNSISVFYSDWNEKKTKVIVVQRRQCDNVLKYRILAGPVRIDGM